MLCLLRSIPQLDAGINSSAKLHWATCNIWAYGHAHSRVRLLPLDIRHFIRALTCNTALRHTRHILIASSLCHLFVLIAAGTDLTAFSAHQYVIASIYGSDLLYQGNGMLRIRSLSPY